MRGWWVAHGVPTLGGWPDVYPPWAGGQACTHPEWVAKGVLTLGDSISSRPKPIRPKTFRPRICKSLPNENRDPRVGVPTLGHPRLPRRRTGPPRTWRRERPSPWHPAGRGSLVRESLLAPNLTGIPSSVLSPPPNPSPRHHSGEGIPLRRDAREDSRISGSRISGFANRFRMKIESPRVGVPTLGHPRHPRRRTGPPRTWRRERPSP